jgi:hypothetical protein
MKRLGILAIALALPLHAENKNCPTCGPRHEHGMESHQRLAEQIQRVAAPAKCDSDPMAPVTPEQQAVIRKVMSNRRHRVGHGLWHSLRDMEPKERSEIANAFGDKRWAEPPPSKSCPLEDKEKHGGEDFLYMHRQMIREMQDALANNQVVVNGKKRKKMVRCIAGWDTLPALNDKRFPVPGKPIGVKDEKIYQVMKKWEETFKDKEWLKGKTLNEVGELIEKTLHNYMHMRWAKEPPPHDGAPLPLDNVFPPGWPFDAESNDYLGDPYSAHVNPIFWKLHIFIDRFPEIWAEANGKRIAETCPPNDESCFAWKGTWVGVPMHEKEPDGSPDDRMRTTPPRKSRGAHDSPMAGRKLRGTFQLLDPGAPAEDDGQKMRAAAPRAAVDVFANIRKQLCP